METHPHDAFERKCERNKMDKNNQCEQPTEKTNKIRNWKNKKKKLRNKTIVSSLQN